MTIAKLVSSFLLFCSCSIPLLFFSSHDNRDALIPFLQGQQYGYSDLKGKLVIPALYDEVEPFDETFRYALVKQNAKWYVINRKGDKLNHAEFDCKPSLESILDDNNGRTQIHIAGAESNPIPNPNLSLRILKPPCSCEDKSDHIIIFHTNSFNSVKLYYPYEHRIASCRLNIYRWYKNNFLITRVAHNNHDSAHDFNYVVYNDRLNPVLESYVKPEFLNDSWLYYNINGQAFIYDINKSESFIVPFENVKYLINDKFLVVSGGPIQQKAFSTGNKNYGLCDLDFNIILDTTYSFIFQEGNFISARKERFVCHLFDYSGRKIFDSAKEIKYNKNTSHFIIKDSLDKSRLYTADLKLLDGQEYDDIQNNGSSKNYQYRRGEMTGILDSNGISIIEYPCERMMPINDSNFYTIIKNRKYGVVDKNLNIVIPTNYGNCSFYSNYGFFRVSSTTTRKNGLINKDGKIIIDTLYDRINYDSIDNQLYIRAERDRKWTYFDTNGDISKEAHNDHSTIWTQDKKEQFAKIQLHYIQNSDGKSASELFKDFVKEKEHLNPTSIMIHPKRNGEYFAATKDLQFIAGSSNDKATVTKFNDTNRLLAFKTDKGEGIVNFENETVLPIGDRKILDIEDHYILIQKDKKYDFYDLDMKKLYPFSFDYADDYNNGPLRVVSKNITGSAYEHIRESCLTNTIDTLIRYQQNYGYVDEYGKICIAPKYAFARDFYDNRALVGNYNKDSIIQNFVIDTLGNVVKKFPLGITLYNWSIDDDCHQAVKNKLHGIIDSLGEIIIPFKYKYVKSIYKDKLFLTSNQSDSSYIINANEKRLFSNKILKKIGPNYYLKKFIPLDNDRYVFSPDGQLQIVDYDGNKLLTFRGQNASMVKINNWDLLEVKDNGLQYYVDPYKLNVYRQ